MKIRHQIFLYFIIIIISFFYFLFRDSSTDSDPPQPVCAYTFDQKLKLYFIRIQ